MTEQKTCPKCGRPLVEKHGKNGAFLACSGYPDCRHCESIKEDTTQISTTTVKKTYAKTTTNGKNPNTVVEELKRTYDEVVASFANDYPETVADPAVLHSLVATVFIEKNRRM